MKIIQSFWSKPLLRRNRVTAAGWPDRRSFYFSCALSALLLKKHCGGVELVTDAFGYELLVERMALPYDRTVTALDALRRYCASLWAVGKILAYALQRESFIHADFDFFVPARLPDRLGGAPLLAFAPETGPPAWEKVYAAPLGEMTGSFAGLPGVFGDPPAGAAGYPGQAATLAYNAGIIGGSELSVFRELKETAFRVIDRNYALIAGRKNPYYNVILEQYLFARLAEAARVPVSCLVDGEGAGNYERYTSMRYFPQTPVHLLGSVKMSKLNCLYIEEALREEFPEHYFRLCRLLSRHQL